MKDLFSINRAADLLEHDRATLVRALRHVPPDGFEHGRPRWFMPTITSALALSPQERSQTGKYRDQFSIGRSKQLDGLRIAFEKQVAQIGAEPSLDKRHAMAVALAPVIEEYQRTYLDIGRALGVVDDDLLGCRVDLVTEEMISQVAEAAGREADSSFFGAMIGAMVAHADGEAG